MILVIYWQLAHGADTIHWAHTAVVDRKTYELVHMHSENCQPSPPAGIVLAGGVKLVSKPDRLTSNDTPNPAYH